MSFYVPPPGGYPDGPLACAENPGCTPFVRGIAEPAPSAYFGLLAGCAVLIVVSVCANKLRLAGWLGTASEGGSMVLEPSDAPYTPSRYRDEGLERALLVGKTGGTQGLTPRKPVSHPERPHRDSFVQPGAGSLQFEGFRSSLLGIAGYLAVWLISFGLVFLYFVLLVDYYSGCQLRGPDAACFYGSYSIFGNYDPNSYIFLGLWCTSLCWVLALFAGCFHQNRFRRPCSLHDAQWVQVKIKDDGFHGSDVSVSPQVTSCVGRYHRWLTGGGEARGRHATVPVLRTSEGLRYVVVESIRYILDPQSGRPRRALLGIGMSGEEILAHSRVGLSREERARRLALLGPNAIPCEVNSLWEAVGAELAHPFYCYQLFTYGAWLWFSYLFVASALITVVLVAAALEVYYTRAAQKRVKQIADYRTTCAVQTGAGQWQENVDAATLVVGDVIRVRGDGWVLPCDAVLVSGTALLDESALTGESMPVPKIALQPLSSTRADLGQGQRREDTTLKEFPSGSILLAGTSVTTIADSSIAVCLATGIKSEKGRMVAHILHPAELPFRMSYEIELPIVLTILGSFAALVVVVTFALLVNSGLEANFVTRWQFVLEAVSETISPLLPVMLLVGQQQAAMRLASRGITTLQPKRIAVAGRVDTVCFDKTGTLTSPDLAWDGVIPAGRIKLWEKDWQWYGNNGKNADEKESRRERKDALQTDRQRRDSESWAGRPVASVGSLPHRIVSGLATCHSLTYSPSALPGPRGRCNYAGNRVDMAMFGATGWRLNPSGGSTSHVRTVTNVDTGEELVVAKQFDFDHQRQLMTVLVQRPTVDDGEGEAYTKGSFEAVSALCEPSSVPAEAAAAAKAYAARGAYVLALALRLIEHDSIHGDHAALVKMDRDEIEKPGYEFLGLVLFQNELQQGTTVADLRAAEVDCRVVTGDNAECGYYVACCAGFLDPGVPVLLGEAASPDSADEKGAVSWTRIGDECLHDHGLPLNTTELLGTLATDIDGEEQGKTNYALVLTGAAWDILRRDGSGLASSLSPRGDSGSAGLCDEALQRLLSHVKVAARFSPGQKEDFVRALAATGRTVAMCGDGSNDCAALRAAHVGLALNGAEASMVSPFSSKQRSIGAMLDLLLEGRSAITTSFAGYRFLILQGLTLATAGIASAYYGSSLSYMGFFFIDAVIITTLSCCMARCGPAATLARIRPTDSLLSLATISSVAGVYLLHSATLVLALWIVAEYPGYVRWPSTFAAGGERWWELADGWESTTILLCFGTQLCTTAMVYSFGGQHRRAVFYNVPLCVCWMAFMLGLGFLLLFPFTSTQPPTVVHAVFHIASIAFNSPSTQSPVWLAYQEAGNPSSEGMPVVLRMQLAAVIGGGSVAVILWEKLVMVWWQRR